MSPTTWTMCVGRMSTKRLSTRGSCQAAGTRRGGAARARVGSGGRAARACVSAAKAVRKLWPA